MNINKTISVVLVLDMILFTGCQSSPHYSTQSSSQTSSGSSSDSGSGSLPTDLTGLENNIETIVKTLNGPAVQGKGGSSSSGQSSSGGQGSSGSSSSSQSGSGEQQNGSSQSAQSGSSGQGSSSSQQGQSRQASGSSGAGQQDAIEKIAPIVESMHFQWNNLMVEAIKKGANHALLNDFDNSLNNLSSTVRTKNKLKIMMAANRCYAYIPELQTLFQTQSSPQIKRVQYYTRSVILNAANANWKQADADMSSLKSVWLLAKNTLDKNQQELANKLDLSINELEKVVKEKNPALVDIKGKVELATTQEVEKAAGASGVSSGSGGGSSSQG